MKNRHVFYQTDELSAFGFRKIGNNVKISKKASIYNPSKVSLGNKVRIDDFCILSGEISLGSHIHISAHSSMYGLHGITMGDFSGLSPHVTILSATDDFSGDFMIGPMVPNECRNVRGGLVNIGKFVQIGVGCVVMPDISINEGAVVGAMSLVNRDIDAWTINFGIPARFFKDRSQKLLNIAKRL